MNICNELRVSLFLQARVISSFHFISPFSSFFLLRGSGAPEPFFICATKRLWQAEKMVLLPFLWYKVAPMARGDALRWGPYHAQRLPCARGAGCIMGSPPKPSASGFGGERRCDGVSETCPASQGRGEGYSVRTDETEGLFF